MEVFDNNETITINQKLIAENVSLKLKLLELENTLNSLKHTIHDKFIAANLEEAKRNPEQENVLFYRQIIDTINDGVIIITADHKIIQCNKILAALLNLPFEKIIGHPIQTFIYKRDLNVFEAFIKSGLKESNSCELRVLNSLGEKTPVLLSGNCQKSDNSETCIIVSDLTKLKKYRDNLEKTKKRLKGIGVQQTNKLNAINKELKNEILERKKLEVKLLDSKERYQSLIESSPDGVIVHQNGLFVYANSVALQLYGAESLEQLQTKTVLDLIHPDDRPTIKMRMQQGMGGQKVPLMETRILDFNNKITNVESVGSRINFQGKPSVQIIIRDITERKKREFELLKLNQTLRALDKSSQAMVRAKDEISYLEEVCKIIINDCFYSMVWIGYAQEDELKTVRPMAYAGFEKGYLETLGLTWSDTERGKGPTGTCIRTGKMYMCRNMLTDPNFAPWRDQALKRGYASSIALPMSMNGKTFGALTIYSREPDPFTSDEAELLNEIANDLAYGITAIRWRIAQQEAEEQLQKYTAELKELNATKDKFFGIIAHDLKNPFASMLGSAEILSNNPNQFDPETIKKFASIMYNAAKSGYSLLENLLEWSRAQTGTIIYQPQKISIKEVIYQNITNVSAMALNKKILVQAEVSNDLEVIADLNMVNTILRNLLTNAIKFSYSGGNVSVKADKKKDEVILSVKDNGIGIPKEDLNKLFKIDIKYTNIGTAEERGTGLGLLLCKEFVEKHGGRIWVESETGKGSVFKFTIPVF